MHADGQLAKHPAMTRPINQPTNRPQGRPSSTSGFPTWAPLPLCLLMSVSLSLSLSLSFCVSEAHRREDTADGEQAIARHPLGHPNIQLAKPWSGQPAEQPTGTYDFPLPLSQTHTLYLSRSPPVSEGILRQESRQARRHRIGQEGRQENIKANCQANSQAANHRVAVRATSPSFRESLSLSLSLTLCLSLPLP